ncbi:helix-turn-helix domain-containing protein [Nocardia sp. ET3-3]|uniref:Helix-turn-helix domain-containing protein n=1 Tax=Nocardia terrae TaxID=2675851 RepID=A0A7K1UR94_9NOCA|nr:helix-turn-helix transcriptional regulator [Nocardia terrae]MVU76864.1 helix-turn-helix domain-containing protein [Nocardia terrae]
MGTAEFGIAVRRRRDQVSPDAAGLAANGARRAPGLRREELALLAGISVDYITRLEQGRASNPSPQVVESLARALRSTPEERAHLYRLAGLALPESGTVPTVIPPAVQRMVEHLIGIPVAVFDASWTLLQANPACEAILGDTTAWHGNARNRVWRHFVTPGSVGRYTPDTLESLETALVSDLRAAGTRYPADTRLRQLITDVRTHSPRFAELWESGVVSGHDTTIKTIDHPTVGPLTLDCAVLTVAGPDLRIMIDTAEPGSEDAQRLSLLTALDTHTTVG